MSRYKFRVWDGENISPTPRYIEEIYSVKAPRNTDGWIFMQWTGLTDSEGVDIYESDVLYLAGYGDCLVEFPFIELYEAGAEGDIGGIKGNIYQMPELMERFK